jgi:hypothetical protein
MVARLDLGEAQVTRIAVHRQAGGTPRILPVVDDDNESNAYPASLDTYRFDVEWSEEAHGKRRRVVVQLDAAVTEASIDALMKPVGSWARLLERSAFALPMGMPDVLDNVMGQVALFDAWSAEIEVPVYQGSDTGWDVLLNLFEASSLGIVSVEIE